MNTTSTNEIELSKPIELGPFQSFDGHGAVYKPAPGYIGPAIQCLQPGFHVTNCTLVGFETGIYVDAQHEANGTGEGFIDNVRVYDYSEFGIDWRNSSDGYISHVVCANTIGANDLSDKTWQPFDSFFPVYGALTKVTAKAGIRLGPGNAGGVSIDHYHGWGNQAVDLAVLAVACQISDCRLEGGRSTMLLAGGVRNTYRNIKIWSVLDGKTFKYGVAPQIGITLGTIWDGNGSPCGNSLFDGIEMGMEGHLPYSIATNRSSGGNKLNILVPPDYSLAVYNEIVGADQLNVSVFGVPDPIAAWAAPDPIPPSGVSTEAQGPPTVVNTKS